MAKESTKPASPIPHVVEIDVHALFVCGYSDDVVHGKYPSPKLYPCAAILIPPSSSRAEAGFGSKDGHKSGTGKKPGLGGLGLLWTSLPTKIRQQ